MAFIASQNITDCDEEEGEAEILPAITIDENHFPWSLFGYQFAMDTAQELSFQQLIRNLGNLEAYCDAPHENFYEPASSCSIDMSIEEAMHFPQKVSSRLPIKTNCTSQHLTAKNLKKTWCDHVSHYLDWVGGVTDLRMMDEKGKIKLITRQLPRIVFLMESFWTYQHDYDGLVLGCGIFFNPKRRHNEQVENMVAAVTDFIHTHVIPTFRRLGVTRAEYLLLKAIALFEALDVHFPPADRLIMEKALSKYRSALVSYIKRIHSRLDHEAVIERVQALLGTLTYLEVLVEFGNEIISDVIVGNNGNMHGRLTIEIHMNSVREL
ncbi:hypothetical protein Aduo_018291 [Ancylostoma duodenale]